MVKIVSTGLYEYLFSKKQVTWSKRTFSILNFLFGIIYIIVWNKPLRAFLYLEYVICWYLIFVFVLIYFLTLFPGSANRSPLHGLREHQNIWTERNAVILFSKYITAVRGPEIIKTFSRLLRLYVEPNDNVSKCQLPNSNRWAMGAIQRLDGIF